MNDVLEDLRSETPAPRLPSAIEPTVADVHADAEFVRFGIDNGRSRICIDYKLPGPDCERWVRWYSWWHLREYDRDTFSEPYPFHDHYAHHYQGPIFPFDEVGKTCSMVMSSQDPEILDEPCVDGYVDLIRAGGRPTTLALG